MYTRCPNCSTIFRVSAAQLRVALGEVSCGSCHETFNALSALTEDLPELTEVVVLDSAEPAPENEERAETGRPAPDTDDHAEVTESAGGDADSKPAEVSLSEAADEEQHPSYAWADPDDEVDVEIGVETDVNDDLIETFVDEADDTGASDEPTDEEPDGEEPDDEAEAEALELDQESGLDEAESEEHADAEPSTENGGPREAEPRYDDHTGFDEEDEDASRETATDDAADAWAGILAEVHEDDLAEARASRDIAVDSAGALEPAYDDHTGIEEILHEGDFADRDDGDAEEDTPPDTQRNDLEFDAPEQSWSDIFSRTDSRQPPYIPAASETDTETERGQSSNESQDLSPLSALESETADPDEWANLLTELAPRKQDEQRQEPTPESEQGGGSIEPVELDYDESNTTEIILSSSDPLPIVREPDSFADGFELEYPASVNDDKRADPLIDYEPEFVPPWESEPAEESGGDDAKKFRIPKRNMAIAALLVVALGTQLIHYNRDSIARHPSWGARIQSIYSALGAELYPDWNLESYRITGSEAVAGRTDKSALDIVANVTIVGDEAVSLPLVRVALQDRWGNAVASRVFKPSEYLGDSATWPERLSPGTTIPVEISVADPGTDAHGYIVDICLPRRATGLQCQIKTEPFRP